jgi:putative transposase
LQQLREALGYGDFRYLIHDRDRSRQELGPIDQEPRDDRAQVAAALPEGKCDLRVVGTIRRECLDWLIPLSESHLRSILKVWVTHYNEARPHMALGPGVPDPPARVVLPANERSRHHLGARAVVGARSVLGGLHREYSLAPALA